MVDSWFPGVLDAVFQITFLSALLLFWLCVYHGLRQNDRRFIIFYLPKVLLVGSIWLSMIVVAVWQDIEEVNDPTFSYKLDTDHFYVTEFNHNIKRATINIFFFFYYLGIQSVSHRRLRHLLGLFGSSNDKSIQ